HSVDLAALPEGESFEQGRERPRVVDAPGQACCQERVAWTRGRQDSSLAPRRGDGRPESLHGRLLAWLAGTRPLWHRRPATTSGWPSRQYSRNCDPSRG